MGRVIHFELISDNPTRTAAFYTRVFDWKIRKWDGPFDYWLVNTGAENEPGINGAIKPQFDPQVSTVNTIAVEAIDLTLDKIRKWGGRVITAKCLVPQVGWLAYCQDTEGNTFGLIQNILEDSY